MSAKDIVYITGDGIGREITPAMIKIVNKALDIEYKGSSKITWHECKAGNDCVAECGTNLPTETLDSIKKYKVAIKGPLTTPVGKGARSINVALRQTLDLYVCLRPVEYFEGVPSPVVHPEKVDMVVFRENTEDIYAGIEWMQGTEEVKKVIDFLQKDMKVTKIRFPQTSSIGIKPISLEGSSRIISSAIDYAIKNNRKSVTVVHKGNIMKFTEGMFRSTAYDLALSKFSGYKEGEKTFVKSSNGSPVQIKDCICDAFLQNILLKPQDYDVIVTPNLNGDYVSDALAAEVGGIGIAPGANINPDTGMAVFEATHGSAPDIAGKGIANPLSILLSACMMLEFIGYDKASVRIKNAVRSQILSKRVTSDFYATMTVNGQKAVCLKLDEFTNELIDRL